VHCRDLFRKNHEGSENCGGTPTGPDDIETSESKVTARISATVYAKKH
jgi:hypothetical protein